MPFNVLFNILLQLGKLFDQKLDAACKGLPYPLRGVGLIGLLLPVALTLQVLGDGLAAG